jgi:uncharacterized metal-binding protein YceD (DUF177 family)
MKIYLNKISEMETEFDFTQDEAWVSQAIAQVDEDQEDDELASIHELRAASPARVAKAKPRPAHVHFSLRNVDDVIVLNGRVETSISLVCSRCANAFKLVCQPNLSGLFCKDPVMAGIAHLDETRRPSGQNRGSARHAHDSAADEAASQGKDLDITYLSNDYVDLSEVLTEHLQLQVPFQPLCREDCKGMCSQCGADLNVGRCACALSNKGSKKEESAHSFSVLKDMKI